MSVTGRDVLIDAKLRREVATREVGSGRLSRARAWCDARGGGSRGSHAREAIGGHEALGRVACLLRHVPRAHRDQPRARQRFDRAMDGLDLREGDRRQLHEEEAIAEQRTW